MLLIKRILSCRWKKSASSPPRCWGYRFPSAAGLAEAVISRPASPRPAARGEAGGSLQLPPGAAAKPSAPAGQRLHPAKNPSPGTQGLCHQVSLTGDRILHPPRPPSPHPRPPDGAGGGQRPAPSPAAASARLYNPPRTSSLKPQGYPPISQENAGSDQNRWLLWLKKEKK